jgi:hypothetical protein
MSRLASNSLDDVLDRCLLKLQAGENLENVLAEYPELADELRPVLETVVALINARGSDTVPIAAMARSRARLMKTAQQIKFSAPLPWWQRTLVFARRSLVPISAAVTCAALVLTGMASAKSLPGQALYPVKRAAEQISLSLPASATDTLSRQVSYDQRRLDEVDQLISEKDEQEVELSGFLTSDSLGWKIDSIALIVPTGLTSQAQANAGRYVSIHGDVLADGRITLKSISQRLYTFSGRISAQQARRIAVSDIWISLDASTEVFVDLRLDAQVRVTVTRLPEGYLAVSIAPASGSTDALPTHDAIQEQNPTAQESEDGTDQATEPVKTAHPPEPTHKAEATDGGDSGDHKPPIISKRTPRPTEREQEGNSQPTSGNSSHPAATATPKGEHHDGEDSHSPTSTSGGEHQGD